jgi:dolichol-phosphate mannosyltransferase
LIDADLQDPPELIPEMVRHWSKDSDVVYGVRVERAGESAFKLWTAKAFYRVINRLSSVAIPVDTGDFRLMDRSVVAVLRAMPERDRFLRGMVSWVGFRQIGIPYRRAARFGGVTKYPLIKMVRFAADGILSFSVVPLKVAMFLGFVSSAIALMGAVLALFFRLFTRSWVPGWTSILLAVLFLGGAQLVCIGIIGEYLGRVYGEVKHRPLYVVRQRLGCSERNLTFAASQSDASIKEEK